MRVDIVAFASRKTHKVRNVVVVAILSLLLIAVLIASISALIGWQLTHPRKLSVDAFSSNIVPDYADATFHDIKDKFKLKGWYFQKKDSDKAIILAHGYKQNRFQFKEKTIDMVKSFLDKGYNVLIFDFRNCGRSEGKTTSVGYYEKDDLLGAVKYVKNKGISHVVLIGYSMGASTSITAAADSAGVGGVDAVIADSPFADLTEYLKDGLTQWAPIPLPKFPFNQTILLSVKLMLGLDTKDVSPIKSLSKLGSTPLLLIHSKDDTQIPVENSQELYNTYMKLAGDKAEFWETEGASHVGSYEKDPEVYMSKVFAFLDRVYQNDTVQ